LLVWAQEIIDTYGGLVQHGDVHAPNAG
jgi:hypothetical protein